MAMELLKKTFIMVFLVTWENGSIAVLIKKKSSNYIEYDKLLKCVVTEEKNVKI